MIFAIGHSNLPLDQFIAVLKTHGVELLVDVRRIPARATTRNSIAKRPRRSRAVAMHRWLIADALTVCGLSVEHIASHAHRQRHRLAPFARQRHGPVIFRLTAGLVGSCQCVTLAARNGEKQFGLHHCRRRAAE